MTAFPAVFVSRGAPPLALEEVAAKHFLRDFGGTLGRPRYARLNNRKRCMISPTFRVRTSDTYGSLLMDNYVFD